MQFFNTRNLTKAVCLFTYSLISLVSATYADDTEIFKTTNTGEESRANILIMLDTSSSMNQSIKYVEGYDPKVANPSTSTDCDEAKIYVDTKGTPGVPNCGNTPKIDASAFRCRAVAEFFIEVGSIGARAKQYNPTVQPNTDGSWAAIPQQENKVSATDPVECLDDEGFHGDIQVLTLVEGKVALDETAMLTETTIDNYVADGDDTNPWSSTEDSSIEWPTSDFATFYTGHFLNYAHHVIKNDPSLYKTTDGLSLAKEAMSNVVANFSGFNLGIGRYEKKGPHKTAFILAPAVYLDDYRDELQRFYIDPLGIDSGVVLDNMDTTTEDNRFSGGQPLSSGQYEAYLYFKGEAPLGGGSGSPNYENVSTPQPPETAGDNTIPQAICEVLDGTPGCNEAEDLYTYISPITDVCAKNYVLFLTAGGSSSDSSNDALINNAELFTLGSPQVPETLSASEGECGASSDYCLDEISRFMYTHDFDDTINNGEADGETVYQNVTTYGISINNSAADLNEAAEEGGGYFRKAENPGTIAAVFEDIISDILGQNSSFVSPSISVNNYNRLQHLNDLYFSLFAPTENAVWDGNLKKYKIIKGIISDSEGKNAVNQTTGAFEINALSFWTNPAHPSLDVVDTSDGVKNIVDRDGDVTSLGGLTSRLNNTTDRKVYTNTGTGKNEILSNNSNKLHESNTQNITKALLNLTDDATTDIKQQRLLKWGRGIRFVLDEDDNETEVFTDSIGDLLHTSPVVVNYYKANQNGPYDGDQTLYFGTNEGFIHGINNVAQNDLTTPIEAFAFAPKEMLPRFNDFYINQATSTKLYGMDGPITYWLDESNSTTPNFEVNSNERAFLYATQRRGGRNIYALEVQDRDNPKLTWSIKGGVTAGYERLGQTWSRIKHATIDDGSDDGIEVVIFGGGYDDNQDALTSAPDIDGSEELAEMGNSIYIADAKTGDLIWSGSPDANTTENTQYSEMIHSIPASVSVIDIDQDGFAEKMYAVDLAGQVWRFDFKTETNSFTVSGGVMAKLNESAANLDPNNLPLINFKNSKRFYSGPSISYLTEANTNFLTIALGSGYRAHPLDEIINDKFYVLKDYNPFGPITDGVNGIIDYSSVMIYDDSDIPNSVDPLQLNPITPTAPNPGPGTHGWAFDFSEIGEKVINPAISIDGKVFFTSYIPESKTLEPGTTNCAPNSFLGKSRLYSIFLKTGAPGFKAEEPNDDTDDPDDTTTVSVYYDEVTAPGASGGPRAIFTPTTGSNPDCASQSDLLVLVGTDVFDPGICTAPVRTYWQRVE